MRAGVEGRGQERQRHDHHLLGQLTSKITSASGRTLSFANDGKHITKVTDSTGRTISYTYSAI
ncbi:hypothetical protein SCALM49S_09162 [Streptomyces californicus]